MTGTRTSNYHGAAWVAILALATATADEVILDGGRRVTGGITALAADGNVTLSTAFAKAPLVLRGDHVRAIQFDPPADAPAKAPHALVLRNNDVIPCEITGMDATQVTIRSAALGDIPVPRDAVRAIRFGLRSSQTILAPPEAFKGWAASEAWKATDDSLASSAVGNTARSDVKLPERFILRCRIEWQGYPNLRFHFADDRLEASGEANRYFLTFNHAGLELKRQSSSGRTYHSLAPIPKSPDSFGGSGGVSGFDLEIRVDRPGRSLQLSINGEVQGTFRDPAEDPPKGNGLMLLSYASGNNRNIIRNLEISDWAPGNDNPAANLPEPAEADSVSVQNAPDTMSGIAQSIRIQDGKPAVVFQSPHAPEALVVTNASLLAFRKSNQAPAAEGVCEVDLLGSGKLRTRACTVDAAGTTADHPLLGTLKLNRAAIRSISRHARAGANETPTKP